MGTNYYLYTRPACPTCHRPHERLHIGKSSAGWVFSLHVGDDIGVYGLPDWEWLWAAPGTYIEDEYGDPVDPAHMKDIITNRTSRDPAIALRRHTDGGIRGVVRGEGTWDLIPGDFS